MTLHNEFKAFVGSLTVSNDEAERNFKLIKDYISGSSVENLRQDLLFANTAKKKKNSCDKSFQ